MVCIYIHQHENLGAQWQQYPVFKSLLTSDPLGFVLLSGFKQLIQPSQFQNLLNHCDREMHELVLPLQDGREGL